MKKLLLATAIIFATFNLFAQKCGPYIELLGKGMYGNSTSTLFIDQPENVDSIVAEAIYKSEHKPFSLDANDPSIEHPIRVEFKFGDIVHPLESQFSIPELIQEVGDPSNTENYVFRAEYEGSVDQVSVEVPVDSTDFYSFAIYVYRNDETKQTIQAGELIHVYHNGPKGFNTEIEIPKSKDLRDIDIRFGITELNLDSREAIFTFWAGEEKESTTVETFDADKGESYIMQKATLKQVPGKIDKITMNMLSEDDGDSFIAGVVLADFPCEEFESGLLCSFTQGFYGNAGGKACGKASTTELLEKLLYEDLLMGLPDNGEVKGNTFTFREGDVESVLALLPGGGPSKVLEGHVFGDEPESFETNKQGRLKNTLLAQGITLALNTRLSSELLHFPVDGTEFVTMMAMDCKYPEAGGVEGTEKTHKFSDEIVDYLAQYETDATIEDLLKLVNIALGGGDISPLSLSQVADAAGLVNEAFDECVLVEGYAEIQPVDKKSGEPGDQEEVADPEGKKGTTGVSDNEEDVLGIYPNPVREYFYLEIPSFITDIKQASIYSLTGVKVLDFHQSLEQGSDQVIEIQVSHLEEGMYFVRIESATGSYNKRFGIQ